MVQQITNHLSEDNTAERTRASHQAGDRTDHVFWKQVRGENHDQG